METLWRILSRGKTQSDYVFTSTLGWPRLTTYYSEVRVEAAVPAGGDVGWHLAESGR